MIDIEKRIGFDPANYEIELEDGTKYLPYDARLLWFRSEYPDGKILSTIVEKEKGSVVFETKIYKDSKLDLENFVSNGYGTGYFNADDLEFGNKFYERAETTSVLRALIKAGIGIGYKDTSEIDKQDKTENSNEKSKISNNFKKDKIVEPEIMTKKLIEENKDTDEKSSMTKTNKSIEKPNEVKKEQINERKEEQITEKEDTTANKKNEETKITEVENKEKEKKEIDKNVEEQKEQENISNTENNADFEHEVFVLTNEDIPSEHIDTDNSIEEEVVTVSEDISFKNGDDSNNSESVTSKSDESIEEVINIEQDNLVEVQDYIEVKDEKEKPKYNGTMSVEEIMRVMTYEEAKNTVITIGYFEGLTMEQLSKTNPGALAWFLSVGNKSKDNIIRAAAGIVIENMKNKEKEAI